MTIRRLFPLALLGPVLALGLAACGAPVPPTDEGPATTDGAPYILDAGPALLALAIGFADATLVLAAGDAVAPADVAELYEGLFVGPFAVEADGVFSVAFPDADEMPAAALVPLAEAFEFNLSSVDCAPTVAPLAAEATPSVFLGVGVPGMVGLTAAGPFLAIASDVEIADGTSIEDFDGAIFTWLFVDRDATLVSGAACATYDVDLDLVAGWNQIAWTFDGAVDVTARVVAPTAFYAAAGLPLEPADPEPPVLLGDGGVGWMRLR